MRRRIALAVIALHCLLLWLLAVGFRAPAERALPQLQIVSLWIDPPRAPEPAQATPPDVLPQRRVQPVPIPPVVVPVTPALESQPGPVADAPVTAPLVDWDSEASKAARRAGEALATPKRESFSEPPKTIAKKCSPKKSTMEWAYEKNPKGGSCMLTIGMNCSATERANGHLFDDMKKGGSAGSSVPDPNSCD